MIGNGCSANQAVPALLNDPKYSVGSLTQIVRSQHYILKPSLEYFTYFTVYCHSTLLHYTLFV